MNRRSHRVSNDLHVSLEDAGHDQPQNITITDRAAAVPANAVVAKGMGNREPVVTNGQAGNLLARMACNTPNWQVGVLARTRDEGSNAVGTKVEGG